MDPLAEPTVFLSVGEEDAGGRLDVFLADRIRECSRTYLQRMIREGNVSVNGAPAKPSAALKPGDEITAIVVEEEPEDLTPSAEPIPLDVIWEDADIIVVNKPPGMASHPSFGHTSGTLVNAVLHHAQQLSDCGGLIRPGIVHRLDLDTSGVIIVARTNRAHRRLQGQFRAREVHKEYRAIAHGRPEPRSGTISAGIARHSRDRKRMRTSRDGKEASTDYKTLERFKRFSYIALRPHSGRTHQIRVHLRSRGHPILCDGLYGREVEADRSYLVTGRREAGSEPVISRQALHAARISFRHPSTNQVVGYEAPIPADMQRALDALVAGG
jgi:23S rRNA pseudouridine1911/1915/1917 synthase